MTLRDWFAEHVVARRVTIAALIVLNVALWKAL